MIQQTVSLNKKNGMYAQTINQLVQAASRFNSDLYLTHKGRKVNLKSVLGIMSLGIPRQAEIIVEASGQDEKEALEQIIETLAAFK